MCPSYMATGDERHSTRARANILREYLSKNTSGNGWNHPEIYEILDLCLSCKGCKSECPSGVDIAKMKGEFLQHWYNQHGIPFRTRIIANITSINRLGSVFPPLFNFVVRNRLLGGVVKSLTGFARERSIPLLYRHTLTRWLSKNLKLINPADPISEVCLFVDEFTNYNDTETGIAAVKLLTSLNYRITTVRHRVSARTFISKGLIKRAAAIATHNINIMAPVAARGLPVLGVEPSAILGFRDEYPDLVRGDLQVTAHKLAPMVMMVDEFIASEFRAGRISRESFTTEAADVLVHIHCQQKAAGCGKATIEALSIPAAYIVREIPSGCCGMAGSFGYEREHFELSNKIGELVLFPEVRSAKSDAIISAPGTSCRHHIADGTGRHALHTVQILYRALIR